MIDAVKVALDPTPAQERRFLCRVRLGAGGCKAVLRATVK